MAEKQRIVTELNARLLSDGFIVDASDKRSDEVALWRDAFQADRYAALFHLGFNRRESWFSPALAFLHRMSETVISRIARHPAVELERETAQVELTDEDLERCLGSLPFVLGMEYVDLAWIRRISKRLIDVFRREIGAFDGTVARYFDEHHSKINVVGRVFFHLVESQDESFPFAFMATYTTQPVKSARAVHTPLKNALKEFAGDEKKILALIATVVRATEKSTFLARLLESGELFSPLKFTLEEAHTLLKEIPIYEDAGILCRVPDWWRKKNNAVRLVVKIGETSPSKVGLDALLDFAPSLHIGDEELTVAQLRQFLDMAEGLIRFKGKWIAIDRPRLTAALAAFDKLKNGAQNETLTLAEALRLELNLESIIETSDETLETTVTNGQWLKSMIETLNNPRKAGKPDIPKTLRVKLRNYQEAGYQWLQRMTDLGFSACLADDMGLGKTIQIIAFLEYRRIHFNEKALLVLPPSLIGNWQREIERFAPKMDVTIHHGSRVDIAGQSCFLTITTYGMASKSAYLKETWWDFLILDEAQAIKNPGAKQTLAVKSIPARMRIALTGTPIENNLGDLWSLYDFLNKGLLGSMREFGSFAAQLADKPDGYAKLRKMIQPFMLRRLKTDKSILADLPDKLEMNVYATLSSKQVALYRQLLKHITHELETAEGIARKGLILSSIMKFKQICNHPDQYLGQEGYAPAASGKFEQLREICETIRDKGERVLIFTQFREMTRPISDYLQDIFDQEGLVFHGGTPIKQRTEMVERFNGENYIPYMVLSLKAGGVGLNLTAANHVIHFDRWWNPAVENQATDRVFRIGQTKNVMVHKFVTKGTIEEKIEQILEDKKRLSVDILSVSAEKWITDFDNKELLKIFALEEK